MEAPVNLLICFWFGSKSAEVFISKALDFDLEESFLVSQFIS